MNMIKKYWLLLAGLLLLAPMLPGCGQVKELSALQVSSPITIDGSDSEWTEGLEQHDNALIGFRNDNDAVYCLLVTGDRAKARQIMMAGLTVYFENPETKAKIGFKYPEGFNPAELRERQEKQGDTERRRLEPGARMEEMQAPHLITVVDKTGNQVAQIFSDENKGACATFRQDGPRFIYEMKIPLQGGSGDYTAPARAGQEIKISFLSGEIDRKKMREKMRNAQGSDDENGPPEAGMQGNGGMGRPGVGMRQGGPGGGGERKRPDNEDKKIDFSFKVKLAGN